MFGVRSEAIDSLGDEARLHPKTAWVSWVRKEEQKRYEYLNASLPSLTSAQIGSWAVYPRR